jgi:hypothetical protein
MRHKRIGRQRNGSLERTAGTGARGGQKKGDANQTSPPTIPGSLYFSVLQDPWQPPQPEPELKLMLELIRNPYPMKSTVTGLAFS